MVFEGLLREKLKLPAVERFAQVEIGALPNRIHREIDGAREPVEQTESEQQKRRRHPPEDPAAFLERLRANAVDEATVARVEAAIEENRRRPHPGIDL